MATTKNPLKNQPAVTIQEAPAPLDIVGLDGLTDKQRVWVEEYLTCWNASEAARRAGYADPGLSGYENRHNPVIEELIARRMEDKAMSANEVLSRLSEQARGSLEPFLVESEDAVFPDLATEEAKKNLHLLKKAKFKKRTWGSGDKKETEVEVELELHDPQAALVHMGRHRKLFTDKTEISTPEGKPIQIEDVGSYTGLGRGELNSRIMEALAASPESQ